MHAALRCSLLQAIDDEERCGFIHAQRRDVHVFQQLCTEPVGAFMLFPAVHLTRHPQKALQRAQLKGRRDIPRLALRRNQGPHHALAGRPARTGEIQQVGAGIQVQGIQPGSLHQLLRPLQPRRKLRVADGFCAGAHIL